MNRFCDPYTLIVDAKGKADGFFIQISDLTEEQREAELKLYNARHDRLTGLYNRDYLYECTRELLDQHPEEPYLIISAEVSDLKVINDLYGNAFGDSGEGNIRCCYATAIDKINIALERMADFVAAHS